MNDLRPATEDALADAVRTATGPLRIEGGGTRPLGQVEGTTLSTAALSGITLHDPGALTLVAQAGTPMVEVEKTLAAQDQRLAFEPMDHRALLGTTGEPTIGGAVAGNVSGPRRVAVGACRDFMLGVRIVDGAGQIVKNGGRVMKNVTGYDLVKLLTGSHGTLGVLTEVSLKVLPKPEAVATLDLPGLAPGPAIVAMSAAFGTPYDVTGAAYLPATSSTVSRTLLRLEGFAEAVAYRLDALRQALAPHGDGHPADDDPWAAIRDVAGLSDMPGDIWRISVRPSEAAALLARLPEPSLYQLDWGGGLIWAAVPEGSDLRKALAPYRGHATRLRGTGPGPVFEPEAAPLAAISAGLRAKFDPRGLFNRGLMD